MVQVKCFICGRNFRTTKENLKNTEGGMGKGFIHNFKIKEREVEITLLVHSDEGDICAICAAKLAKEYSLKWLKHTPEINETISSSYRIEETK